MLRNRSIFGFLVCCLWLLTGCVALDGRPLAEVIAPVGDGKETTAVATVEFPLLPMSDGEPLRPLEVFRTVSPSVPFIKTPAGAGSGILIDDGYVVSNAHVVWPYNSVRVVFPDGTEFPAVEVVGWDLTADLALLKLPDTPELEAQPLHFVDGSELTMASDIYLIGYPGEVESFPQPAIVQGILGRVRTWEATGMKVFQADADVAGGQSGGVMLTERGEVIGITTFRFTTASYALVPSADYVVPRLNALVNDPNAGFSQRRTLGREGATEYSGELEDQDDSDVYILDVEGEDEVEITVAGVGQPFILATSLSYGWNYVQSEPDGENTQTATIEMDEDSGPMVVRVSQLSPFRNQYTLTSSHPIAPYDDSEDDQQLVIDERLEGAIDYVGDMDKFTIELKEGEKIAVEVDSLGSSPILSILYTTPTLEEFYRAYDGGSTSVFGENARLVYVAPKDGEYTFIVSASGGEGGGGYFITTTMADEGEKATVASETTTYRLSGYGKLQTYESDKHSFTLAYPGEWTQSACPEGTTACFGDPRIASLFIAEEDLTEFPMEMSDLTLEGYVDLLEELMLANVPSAKLLKRETLVNAQGLEGIQLVVSGQSGLVVISRFVYVNEDSIAFNATYLASSRAYESLEPFIEYSYKTFREWDEDNLEEDPVYHLDEGVKLVGEKEFDLALEELNTAIEMNPELKEAYAMRSSVYLRLAEYDLALADIERAIELDPEDDDYVSQKSFVYWYQGDSEMAVEIATQYIELASNKESAYNNRALMRALAGDFEGALADMDEIVALSDEEELSPAYLDSRAFIYLKMESYEDAQADYEAALDKDFKSPYVLFGAGIVYARLGMMDEAMALLEYGKELYEKGGEENPSPQMADLLQMIAEYIDIE